MKIKIVEIRHSLCKIDIKTYSVLFSRSQDNIKTSVQL